MRVLNLVPVLLACSIAAAQAPQIPLTGNIGAGGVFPLINSPAVIFASDANKTMAYPEMSGSSGFIKVTSSVSLTATRNLIAPLTKGFTWAIENATTGGQSIQVIGSTGTGITIPNGNTTHVYSDGTNYVQATVTGGCSPSGANGSLLYVNGSGCLPSSATTDAGGDLFLPTMYTVNTPPSEVVAATGDSSINEHNLWIGSSICNNARVLFIYNDTQRTITFGKLGSCGTGYNIETAGSGGISNHQHAGVGDATDLYIQNRSDSGGCVKIINEINPSPPSGSLGTMAVCQARIYVKLPFLFDTDGSGNTGQFALSGNTANNTLLPNAVNILGPNVASFTAYALQFPSTPPSAGNVMLVGAPSGGIAQVTYGTAPSATSIPFSGVTSGTNTGQTMHVGSSSILDTLIGGTISATSALNLANGALGSVPYQSSASNTTLIASPTTTGHTFALGWQPSGSAIAPTAIDLGTYLASPPSIGTTAPGSGYFNILGSNGDSTGTPNFFDWVTSNGTTGTITTPTSHALATTGITSGRAASVTRKPVSGGGGTYVAMAFVLDGNGNTFLENSLAAFPGAESFSQATSVLNLGTLNATTKITDTALTSGQVIVAGTAGVLQNGGAIAGAGAGFTTGPISGTTGGHDACFTGTTGQIQDCGFAAVGLGGSAFVVVTGTGAGVSGVGTVAISGFDATENVQFQTGLTPAASAVIMTVTFTASRGHTSNCVFSPSNAASAAVLGMWISNSSATGYTLNSGTVALPASTNMSISVVCP